MNGKVSKIFYLNLLKLKFLYKGYTAFVIVAVVVSDAVLHGFAFLVWHVACLKEVANACVKHVVLVV